MTSPEPRQNEQIYFTDELNGFTLTVSIVSNTGVDPQDIRDRQSAFRVSWDALQKNASDPVCALVLIHAAFEAERADAITSLLLNHKLIDNASLLIVDEQASNRFTAIRLALFADNKPDAHQWELEQENRICRDRFRRGRWRTFLRWSEFLWNSKLAREAVKMLEDIVVASKHGEITGDDATYMLPDVIKQLCDFHYIWAQYSDPVTGVKAAPEVRIVHLNRVVELGPQAGYLFKFLAEAYHDLGNDDEARAYLRRAWEISPELSAVRIAKALGATNMAKSPQHTAVPAGVARWTRASQIPTERQVLEWTNASRWDLLTEYANPTEYSQRILPKARNVLRLITISLGRCRDNQGASEALFKLLDFPLYFDLREAAAISPSKVGDKRILTLMKEFERHVNAGQTSWRPSGAPHLRNAIAYLWMHLYSPRLPIERQFYIELIERAKRRFDRGKYGIARYILEQIVSDTLQQESSYFIATVLLARCCAQMHDVETALLLTEPVLHLAEQSDRQTINHITNLLSLCVGEYSPQKNNLFKCGVNLEFISVLTATAPDEILRPLRNLTRWLERLGVRGTTMMLRDLIRKEAPGTSYVDPHDRLNYVQHYEKSVKLSDEMQSFLQEFDVRVKRTVQGKLKEIIEGEPSAQ